MKVKVGTPKWKALLEQIKCSDKTLTSLDLSWNQIEDSDAQALSGRCCKNIN